MSRRRVSLRTRLTAAAVIAAAITLAILVAAFNLVLDARLRSDADNVLRERATTVLRGLATTDGRLSLPEAPDQGAVDAQTWIFAGTRTLEQPAGTGRRDRELAAQLGRSARSAFATNDASDTRLYAAPVSQGGARLGTVVVAASLGPYERSASAALLASVLLGLLTLVAIAALSRWLISRALRPVSEMTAQAADWGERDLSRRFFAGEPHDELSTLASVFDGLLARLAQSLRREQRLTAEVSHELRTPLAKILAEAELATSRDRDSTDYRASLQSITKHAHELQRVLETLLASARAAAPGRVTASDALQAARRVAASLQETLAAQGKSIDVVGTRPVRAAVEADVLERILSPLLENAARHTERRITLEVHADRANAIVEIADDGPGVAAAERERIFDPGFRGGPPVEGDRPGAGLGLPLARRLARAAGGDVEARAATGGGRFVVRLPLA
jgi:signal transduction histidine kinase